MRWYRMSFAFVGSDKWKNAKLYFGEPKQNNVLLDLIFLSHPDIREINPGLTALFEMENADSLGASMPIHVCRREEGTSTTGAITEYLHLTCPQAFPEEMVGDLPPWSFDTQATRGSIGMNECIEGRSGSIGYNAAGHGWFAGLDEISIKNKYGRLLTSFEASANGGIGAKDPGILPDDPRSDLSSVSLFDQDGEWTWPITLLSYIVVRGDLSFKTDPDERTLLLALIEALFNPVYVSKCEEEY